VRHNLLSRGRLEVGEFLVEDLIPFRQLVSDLFHQLGSIAFNRDFFDDVILGDPVYDLLGNLQLSLTNVGLRKLSADLPIAQRTW
jgi:hypothetical protein